MLHNVTEVQRALVSIVSCHSGESRAFLVTHVHMARRYRSGAERCSDKLLSFHVDKIYSYSLIIYSMLKMMTKQATE